MEPPPSPSGAAPFDPPAVAATDETVTPECADHDENVDSGICVGESEAKSNDISMRIVDDNSKMELGEPSTSVENKEEIKKPRRNLRSTRSYRLRSNSRMSTDSDDTGLDSDDDSMANSSQRNRPSSSSSSSSTASASSSSSSSSDDNSNDDETSSLMDDDLWSNNWSEDSNAVDESNNEIETPGVLLNKKSPHNWHVIKELMKREIGLSLRPGKSGKSDVIFEQKFYGSLHAVERLELMYKLNKHKGCVNSINFHPEGNLLASGSDDLKIIIWDWTTNTVQQVLKTDHKSNIFQSRFLYLNSASQLNIVSCARDGQVILTQLLSSGGPPIKRKLAEHTRSAHKLYTNPAEPHIVVSAGEDGQVILSDVRQEKPNKLLVVRNQKIKVALYSVAGHPLDINEMCVAGKSRYVSIYDRRKAGPNAQPTQRFCPEFFRSTSICTDGNGATNKHKSLGAYVTCAVYNYNGSEILASYNDDDIYLFDTLTDSDSVNDHSGGGFTHMYCGHRNSATFKGVSFFGPQSEFVVSGSDCSYIYIWEKKTQAIVQWMVGDENGVVNCIECHPRFPILATAGLDSDVKIWVPSNENKPELEGLREVVMKNSRERVNRPLFNFFPIFHNIFTRDASNNSDSDSAREDIMDDNPCRAF